MKFLNNQKPSLHINCIKFEDKYLKFVDSVNYHGYILRHNLINKKDIIKKKERNFIGNLTVLFEISFIVI